MKDGFGTLLGKMRQYFYITFPFQLTLNMDPTDKNKSRLELWIPKRDVNSKIPYKYVNFLKSDPVSLCYLVAQFNKLRYHFPSWAIDTISNFSAWDVCSPCYCKNLLWCASGRGEEMESCCGNRILKKSRQCFATVSRTWQTFIDSSVWNRILENFHVIWILGVW